MRCWFVDGANECLSPTEQENTAFATLKRHFDFAFNETTVRDLGQRLVDACPLMSDNEDEVVSRATGTNRQVLLLPYVESNLNWFQLVFPLPVLKIPFSIIVSMKRGVF